MGDGTRSGVHWTGDRQFSFRSVLIGLLLFVFAGLFLFLNDNRAMSLYDEGITLTAAMRIAAGQVIYRDFYFNYGPGNIYILAGLFKVFGESTLVERLWFLVQAAISAAGIYFLARRLANRVAACAAFVGGLLWSMTLGFMTLFTLWSTWLLVQAARRQLSVRRSFAAGVLVSAVGLIRNDVALGVAGAHIAALVAAGFIRERSAKAALRTTISSVWPYLLGCAVFMVPLFVAYRIAHVIPDFMYDIVQYPAKYYHAARNLPFPKVHRGNLADLVVYVLPVLIAVAFCAAIYWIRNRQSSEGVRETAPMWVGALLAFGLIGVVMYLKGLVRIGAGPLFLCSGVCLLIAAVLYTERRSFPSVMRFISAVCIALFAVAGIASTRSSLRQARLQRGWMTGWFVARDKQAPLPPFRWWCQEQNAASKGLCYFVDADHLQAITYIDQHTTPNDTLYVGLTHTDRILINDNLTYFAAQRLPATKWSHFDPFLQNRADLQQEMVGEMERNRPPYVVLDSEFQDAREPNGSSVSTGVHLLDDYIAAHYRVVAKFGELTILRLEKTTAMPPGRDAGQPSFEQ